MPPSQTAQLTWMKALCIHLQESELQNLKSRLAVGDTTWFEETLIYLCCKHYICRYDNLDASQPQLTSRGNARKGVGRVLQVEVLCLRNVLSPSESQAVMMSAATRSMMDDIISKNNNYNLIGSLNGNYVRNEWKWKKIAVSETPQSLHLLDCL